MIGASGSRHLNSRRRGSSPNVSPHLLHLNRNAQSLSTQHEADEGMLMPELPPGVRLSRRRAVDTSDHKTCALLHTRLKGLWKMWLDTLRIFHGGENDIGWSAVDCCAAYYTSSGMAPDVVEKFITVILTIYLSSHAVIRRGWNN
ncbi:uncharacterized protein TNIN_305831 [Trichonephila inaurata madagascariensis]|uniref:Uncharacterized protein n=1 Tax=Trichonephila inaurata madagascariensis TaxID=2747483 RepID=A0A8X7CU64_9ARAC|nr:uncharacterized protein TNIN_305831 [Trichonephila inaurata madagascariensis]